LWDIPLILWNFPVHFLKTLVEKANSMPNGAVIPIVGQSPAAVREAIPYFAKGWGRQVRFHVSSFPSPVGRLVPFHGFNRVEGTGILGLRSVHSVAAS